MKNLVQDTKIGSQGYPPPPPPPAKNGLYARAAFTSIVEAQLATDDISKV